MSTIHPTPSEHSLYFRPADSTLWILEDNGYGCWTLESLHDHSFYTYLTDEQVMEDLRTGKLIVLKGPIRLFRAGFTIKIGAED